MIGLNYNSQFGTVYDFLYVDICGLKAQYTLLQNKLLSFDCASHCSVWAVPHLNLYWSVRQSQCSPVTRYHTHLLMYHPNSISPSLPLSLPPSLPLSLSQYNDANIQLLDLPGIIEGASQGKGRGRQVIAVARTSDLVLMMLDASKGEVQR